MDIVGIGDSGVDLVVEVDHLPSPDEKVRGKLLGKHPGGIVANFCCAAARVGARTGIVSTVGDDSFGEVARENLEEFGVDTGGWVIHEDTDTYFCVVHLDGSGEKALSIVETPNMVPSIEDLDIPYIRRAEFAHLTTLGLELARHLTSLESLDVNISLDVESTAEGVGYTDWKPVIGSTHVVFVNERGLTSLLGSGDRRGKVLKLLREGPQIVVLTRGSGGVEVHRESGSFALDAHEVTVRDTTGAGDCFNAVFLAGLVEGREIRETARRANAAAALTVREVGARSALPRPGEIDLFLRNAES